MNILLKNIKSVSYIILAFCLFCIPASAEQKNSPKRIICLSPSGAEIIFAIDASDKIVARTDFCNYPEEVKSLPSVGGFDGKTLSIETILSFNPDFVYGSAGMHDFLKNTLESLGIQIYLGTASDGISQTKQEILYISELLEKDTEGKNLIENIERQIKSVPVPKQKKTVYYEVWHEPFMTAGKNSFINELLEAAGFKNIFDDINENYPMISEESIIARQPQIIIIPDANGITPQNIEKRSGWKKIPAVKTESVYMINADLISRPGPRIGEAVIELSRLTGLK